MTKTIFDASHLALWRAALDRGKPAEISDEHMETLEQIDSFRAQPMTVGEVLRIRRKDGSILDIVLNPVVARHLAASILLHGQEAGWLDEKGEITFPPLSFDA